MSLWLGVGLTVVPALAFHGIWWLSTRNEARVRRYLERNWWFRWRSRHLADAEREALLGRMVRDEQRGWWHSLVMVLAIILVMGGLSLVHHLG
jgi:hypothetical protein